MLHVYCDFLHCCYWQCVDVTVAFSPVIDPKSVAKEAMRLMMLLCEEKQKKEEAIPVATEQVYLSDIRTVYC